MTKTTKPRAWEVRAGTDGIGFTVLHVLGDTMDEARARAAEDLPLIHLSLLVIYGYTVHDVTGRVIASEDSFGKNGFFSLKSALEAV